MKRVSALLSVVFLGFAVAGTSPEPAAMLLFGGGLVSFSVFNNKSRDKSEKIKSHNQSYQIQKQVLSGFLFSILYFTL
jgi:hypothetical protein